MKNTHTVLILACTCIIISGCISSHSKVTESRAESNPSTNSTSINKIDRKQQIPANFSGRWILVKDLSDDPQEKLKEVKSHSGKSGKGNNTGGKQGGKGNGRGQGRGQGRGKKNHNSSGKGSGSRQGSFPHELQVLLNSSEVLELKHEEPLLIFITKNGLRQHVYTDFRGTSISAKTDIPQKIVTAGWENEELVIETTFDSFRLIQRYKLYAQSRQLWISSVILISSLPKAVQFNQVYRLAETNTK
jgi:hypothetical protein